MSIIRFMTDEVFATDSSEYEILTNAVAKIKNVQGAVVEIGTRRGGSAKMIIDTLVSIESTNRSMFCIDPYGNIEMECTNFNMTKHYPDLPLSGNPESKDITSPQRYDYTNEMRNRVIPSLYYYAYQTGLNFTFFCLEDIEFFNRYADGVPVYDQVKKLENQYALWFIDGPHVDDIIMREVEFFEPRTPTGGIAVFDDIWMANHDTKIEPYLLNKGWELLEKKVTKASYIKK